MGHNMPLAAIGVFLFGSVGMASTVVQFFRLTQRRCPVVVTTSLAAAAGVLAASLTAQVVLKTLTSQWL